MSLNAARVTVTTAATRLDNIDTTEPHIGGAVALKNLGAVSVFLGGPDVTSLTGWEIPAGEPLSLDLPFWYEFYAVAASGTAVVQVLTARGE